MNKLVAILILSFFHGQLQPVRAQEPEKPRIPTTFELEIDPIAYALNGYSVHAIYAPGRFRFDAGVYGIEVPQGMEANEGFTTMHLGFGVKANYLLTGITGLFVGVGGGYSTVEATHNESGTTAIGHTIGAGVHIGYRFFLMKDRSGAPGGLYLAPWVGLDRNFHTEEVAFSGMDYTQSDWQVFPTVHIGYRF